MPPLPTYFFLAPLCPPWIYEDGSAALATDRHLQQRPLFLPEERFRGTETLRDPIVIPCSCVNDAAGRAGGSLGGGGGTNGFQGYGGKCNRSQRALRAL
ncbi:hypothetical protein NDU88_000074 [Pleurodeles waltl]|uniref:Secreted protein n=1 Tax=Pleurodeles waltl TaxID=8319 RepID=A0AAV7UPQ8_PLEWA|nr:hypothetical protein NDU88_000074 [Pleurodeles waltl]